MRAGCWLAGSLLLREWHGHRGKSLQHPGWSIGHISSVEISILDPIFAGTLLCNRLPLDMATPVNVRENEAP